MQYDDFASSLNNKQLEAVTAPYQYVRVVAGAGSGKTRVLTYRISYLLSFCDVEPWKVLAITFTNKVANEMKNRVVNLVPEASSTLTIKTFHSFAAMFLRIEIPRIGYPSSFTILDEEDQLKLIKDIASEKGYRKTDPIVKRTVNYIGFQKLNGKYPDDINVQHESFEGEKVCLEIYQVYEEYKARQFALDFDDLLLQTNRILTEFPDVRGRWQERYKHILIDEFQDTNDTEYKLIKLLMNENTNLYVVGDPDQTIYTWRGANQDIILKLEKTFPTLRTIVMDENYRSTQTILDSANKLIACNKMRVPKDLFTNNGKGDSITVRCLDSGIKEAEYVAKEILTLTKNHGYKYSDIAILYRSNYITLEFEKAFMARNIPYVIYGSVKFYQRMEVKDVIAYFRIVNNPKDDISYERIINVPKRGIGEKTIQIIRENARNRDLSLYDYILSDYAKDEVPAKTYNSLKSMELRIELAKEQIGKDEEMPAKILEDMISDIGYFDYLKEYDEAGEDRIENVKSLFEDLRHYLATQSDASFEEYLQNVSLVSAQDDMKDGDKVTLMTVHTAKGLEYPVVFIVRLNQEVFPNLRAVTEGGYKGLEEERRLAYVAFTRAKQRLYLTLCAGFSYVAKSNLTASQFLKESGNQYISQSSFTSFDRPVMRNENKYRYSDYLNQRNDKVIFDDEPIRQDFSQVVNDVSEWHVGDIVIHKRLGRGTVSAVEEDSIIVVDFEDHGKKTILGNHPFVSKGKK